MIHYLNCEQVIPAPVEQVWEYFCNPVNLNEITPPDMNFEIVQGAGVKMYAGQVIEYRVEFIRGIRSLWLTEIAHVQANRYFVDEQRVGPYRFWYHEHLFEPSGRGTRMTDKVTYVVPYGIFGDALNSIWIRKRLEGIFDYRRRKIVAMFGEAP